MTTVNVTIGISDPVSDDTTKRGKDIRCHADVTINICIQDTEKGTKKIKEMKELLRKLQGEACSLKTKSLFTNKNSNTQMEDLVRVFAEMGGVLIQVRPDPSAFVVRYYSKEHMQQLMRSGKSGDLKKKLETTLLTEGLSKRNYKKWTMTVDVDEKEYKNGLKAFAKDRKAQDAAGPSGDTNQPPTHGVHNFLRDAKNEIRKADIAIEKLKQDIKESCDRLEQLCTQRAETESSSRRHVQMIASDIEFADLSDAEKEELKVSRKDTDAPKPKAAKESGKRKSSNEPTSTATKKTKKEDTTTKSDTAVNPVIKVKKTYDQIVAEAKALLDRNMETCREASSASYGTN